MRGMSRTLQASGSRESAIYGKTVTGRRRLSPDAGEAARSDARLASQLRIDQAIDAEGDHVGEGIVGERLFQFSLDRCVVLARIGTAQLRGLLAQPRHVVGDDLVGSLQIGDLVGHRDREGCWLTSSPVDGRLRLVREGGLEL